MVYRIVGADEFDPDKGWISVDAPLAQALLKKFVEDEVQVHTLRVSQHIPLLLCVTPVIFSDIWHIVFEVGEKAQLIY